jgi:hypothetical protein
MYMYEHVHVACIYVHLAHSPATKSPGSLYTFMAVNNMKYLPRPSTYHDTDSFSPGKLALKPPSGKHLVVKGSKR